MTLEELLSVYILENYELKQEYGALDEYKANSLAMSFLESFIIEEFNKWAEDYYEFKRWNNEEE